MKALTLTQPWATLVASGAKHYETRSWSTNFRGQIAIHAAKGWKAADRDFAASLAASHSGQDSLLGFGFCYYQVAHGLPRGMIIAIAELADVVFLRPGTETILEGPSRREQEFGDFTLGRYAWRLVNVRKLLAPIRCQGALGLWPVSADAEAQILAQLENR